MTANAQSGLHQSTGQTLIQALRITEPLNFCGEPVPIKETDVKERLEREMLVALDNSDDVILWLKRSHRYFPHIEKVLKDKSLPDDLKYIVIAESSLKPLAASHKGAVGFWQFIESTGSRYGMKINNDVDERRNLYASTGAAMSYLKDLYAIFGSWALAAAAYNMGEDGLRTEMLMQKEDNYFRLYLNEETQRYVFRILAAKIILSDPEKYGFHAAEDDLYQPVQYDRVEITISQTAPLYLVAKAANTYFKVIKDLNPQLKTYSLSAGKHDLLLPKGSASGFSERYENLFIQWLEEKGKSVYVVQRGDTLSGIAARFNVPVKAIMKWNNISNPRGISPGEKLFVFSKTDKSMTKENDVKTVPENSVRDNP